MNVWKNALGVIMVISAIVVPPLMVGCHQPPQAKVQEEKNPHSLFWDYQGSLTVEQADRLQQIKALKTAVRTKVVTVNWAAVDGTYSAVICLPGDAYIPIQNYTIIRNGDRAQLNWSESGSSIVITKYQEYYSGMIYTPSATFVLESIDTSLHTITQIQPCSE